LATFDAWLDCLNININERKIELNFIVPIRNKEVYKVVDEYFNNKKRNFNLIVQ